MTGARDSQRCVVYNAEHLLMSMLDHAGPGGMVQIAGTTVVAPSVAKFASIDSIQRYVDQVLARPSVAAAFGPVPAVRVRERRGANAAHYQPHDHTIAVPASRAGAPMRSECVVLHELSHHLTGLHHPDSAAHSADFITTLLWLHDDVIGPEAAFLLRILLLQNGAAIGRKEPA